MKNIVAVGVRAYFYNKNITLNLELFIVDFGMTLLFPTFHPLPSPTTPSPAPPHPPPLKRGSFIEKNNCSLEL